MKYLSALIAAAILFSATTQAGVIVGGTRLIYNGAKKESSLSVSNPDQQPYLVQSWVETTGSGVEKAPFMITPPLFRLDSEQTNMLRVVRAGGQLSNTQETLYWLNIKSIPSSVKQEGQNTLQVAIKTRIKLIYRPESLKNTPEDVADKLTWQHNGNQITVNNPTPFYMNFQKVDIDNKEVVEATYVAPNSSASFSLPSGIAGNKVHWKLINDYGGIGAAHSATF